MYFPGDRVVCPHAVCNGVAYINTQFKYHYWQVGALFSSSHFPHMGVGRRGSQSMHDNLGQQPGFRAHPSRKSEKYHDLVAHKPFLSLLSLPYRSSALLCIIITNSTVVLLATYLAGWDVAVSFFLLKI
jgi:hypothetical protein